jgi:soluble lytic murein transglycosylase-like protein
MQMSDQTRWLRRLSSSDHASSACAALRMSLVSLTAMALLVSLPGWLRGLEQASFPIPSLHSSAAPAPLLLTTAATDTSGATSAAKLKSAVSSDAATHRLLAEFLAQRHRASREAIERFVRLAYMAGHSTRIDPLLIVAVMAVESNFNPLAESVMGAKGLMQIIPHYHEDKLRAPHGGQANVLDPEVNIVAGAKVLREYAARTGGDLPAALGLYGGVGPDPSNSYTSRVMAEWQRLEQFVRRLRTGGLPAPEKA